MNIKTESFDWTTDADRLRFRFGCVSAGRVGSSLIHGVGLLDGIRRMLLASALRVGPQGVSRRFVEACRLVDSDWADGPAITVACPLDPVGDSTDLEDPLGRRATRRLLTTLARLTALLDRADEPDRAKDRTFNAIEHLVDPDLMHILINCDSTESCPPLTVEVCWASNRPPGPEPDGAEAITEVEVTHDHLRTLAGLSDRACHVVGSGTDPSQNR